MKKEMRQSVIYATISLLVFLFSCNSTINQNNNEENSVETHAESIKQTIKETIKDEIRNSSNDLVNFIPENFSLLDTASGDLNLDGIHDLILVLKRNGEDSLSDVVDHPEKRPLLILLKDNRNELKLVRKNDNTVYCFDCGGGMGDPYVGLTIKNGYFSVEHYGGSSWRWTRIITYKYSKQDKEWFLHKDGSDNFNSSDPEKIESTIKTTKNFGKVKFEEFDIYSDK